MDNLRGAVLMVLSMAGFAVEDMFIKLLGGAIPVGQIMIMLGTGGASIFALWAVAKGQRPVTRAMLGGASGLRAAFDGVATVGFVTALTLVPISVVTTIIQVNPLLVTLGAALFFGEKVGWRRWTAISVGLAGVLIVLRPFGQGFEAASLFAVVGVLFQTARDLATRRISRTITTLQLSTLGFLAAVPAGILALLIQGQMPVWPSLTATTHLGGAIAAGIPAIYCIIASMRIGDISFVAPFRYSRILFGLTIGVIAFGEHLDFYTLAGAAIIVGSGLYSFARENALRRRMTAPPSPTVG